MTDLMKVSEEISENNKNKNLVRCQFCNSLILRENAADFVKKEFQLPLLIQKNDRQEVGKESLEDFWTVNDMYTFENIGFSHLADNVKYLICADCEMGPVGYQDQSDKLCYVALVRVKHDSR